MSAVLNQQQMNQLIERDTERLPRKIRVSGEVYKLEVSYLFDTVDRWYLGYTTEQPHPEKKVFMFYEESDLKSCAFKAWRHFAESKDSWIAVSPH